MNRAEQRARTARIVKRRVRQALLVVSDFENVVPGKGRKKSYLDCGGTQCATCHWGKLNTKESQERIERQAARQGA